MKVCLLILFSFVCFAQTIYEVEPVVVTANRYPKNILEITRTVVVIDSTELNKYASITQALKDAAGLDLRIRGNNIQADPSIRGSTFQQVLVMIDGVRVNDPQTGHHNLNIPVPLSQIERIEILKGSASSLYGSDACGGVINIITKKTGRIGGGLGIGNFGYKEISAMLGVKNLMLNFSADSSDGYALGYEHAQYNIGCKFSQKFGNNIDLSIMGGYLNKRFGAKNFYAPYASWEENQAFFVNLNNQWFVSPRFMLNPIFSFRTHIDTFILDRNRPEFYANRHQSFSYNAHVIGNLDLKSLGFYISGIELIKDSLNSTRLGQRQLQRIALFVQIEKKFFQDRGTVVSGIRDDYYFDMNNSINPHFSFSYSIKPSIRLNAGFGSSFRVPSFTELYYQDPVNKGDSLLMPEYAREYELSFSYLEKILLLQSTVFLRNSKDDIDWIKKIAESIWQVWNSGETKCYGFESAIQYNPNRWFFLKAGLSCIQIFKQLPPDYISKYSLQIPEYSANSEVKIFSLLEFSCDWYYYEAGDTRFLLNAFIRKDYQILKRMNLTGMVGVTNFLDKKYYDFKDVPLPGRVFTMRLNITKI